MHTGAQRFEAALTHMVATGADAGSIADAACAVWHRVSIALSPIIGTGGVAALFKRSLHLTRAAHPQLPTLPDDAGVLLDFTKLHDALSSQTSAGAAAANGALLITFYDLLSSLIGASLTERLLEPVFPDPSTFRDAQGQSQ